MRSTSQYTQTGTSHTGAPQPHGRGRSSRGPSPSRSPRAAATTTRTTANSGATRRQGDRQPPSPSPSWTARTWRSPPSGAAPSRPTSRRFSPSSRSGPGAKVTFVPAQDPIVNFLGSKVAGGQPPDVAMLPQVGRHQAGRGQEVGQAARAPRPRQLAQELLPGLAGPRQGRRQAVRRLLQGRQQVPGLVQRQGLRERGRHRAQDLGRLLTTAQTVYDSGVTAVLGRRRRGLDPHRLVREHLPLPGGPGEVRPAGQARDQVDGPVREGRADHARRSSGARRTTSRAARTARCRRTSRPR